MPWLFAVPSNASADTSSAAQTAGSKATSGQVSPFSHLETAWAETPTRFPTCSCVSPWDFRASWIERPNAAASHTTWSAPLPNPPRSYRGLEVEGSDGAAMGTTRR